MAADPHQLTDAQREGVESIVRQYILDHPEIIPEAMKRLQARQATERLQSYRSQIETPFASAWAGNPNGDVVLVEFFDYACPYCRASKADVDRLLAEDKKLKVVYRDFPVLGPASEQAAVASLLAARQGKYKVYHDMVFKDGRPSPETVNTAIRRAGLNDTQTKQDLASGAVMAEIQKNLELGRALGVTGTPAYVVGDRVLPGAVGYEELKRAIADARSRG